MVDLDGTLLDTKKVNYMAYRDALQSYGYSIDYEYYCQYCNGRHYLDFLPQITTDNKDILKQMHTAKKRNYSKYLKFSKLNHHLTEMLHIMHTNCNIALVTTASKENTYEILEKFCITELFDLVLTYNDVRKCKPDPEGFKKAMTHFHVTSEETIVFEDSDIGIKAAVLSGAQCFVVKGFN